MFILSLHQVVLAGVLLLISTACWVALSQMTRVGFEMGELSAPLLVVYIGTSLLVLVYPIYFTNIVVTKATSLSLKDTFM